MQSKIEFFLTGIQVIGSPSQSSNQSEDDAVGAIDVPEAIDVLESYHVWMAN